MAEEGFTISAPACPEAKKEVKSELFTCITGSKILRRLKNKEQKNLRTKKHKIRLKI